jgi:hypothetical protein
MTEQVLVIPALAAMPIPLLVLQMKFIGRQPCQSLVWHYLFSLADFVLEKQ